jgi:hypothetical protein
MILRHLRGAVDSYQTPSSVNALDHSTLSPPLARVLTCIQCSLVLGSQDSIFQVPGASGTIGAYVNPHG